MAEPRSDRPQLRVSPHERTVIQRVAEAEASRDTVTDYVVRHAVSAANSDLADRRHFALDDAAWAELQTLLERPAVRKPALQELFAQPEPWAGRPRGRTGSRLSRWMTATCWPGSPAGRKPSTTGL